MHDAPTLAPKKLHGESQGFSWKAAQTGLGDIPSANNAHALGIGFLFVEAIFFQDYR